MTDRVDSLLEDICEALRDALATGETITDLESNEENYSNLYSDADTVWRGTSDTACNIEEDDAHFDDDADVIAFKWEEDLNSYIYNLLSEDPYGVLQPENGDPDDVQDRFRKIGEQSKRLGEASAKAAPSVKDRIREAYKNYLGANTRE
ncbi:hypothetical protein AARAC_009576 [Aspergillus arachidicola]|uniref:Uncharacterized protein n=1 Tax=Aspergillus arachidicola TaxID=656916 RepID=A0A2G7EL63_9EURO|nr:hypothetical protein AARAC_009576 [Aspergillus arachidicola]